MNKSSAPEARKAIILSNDAARLKEEPTFSKNDLKILTDDQLITVGMMSKKPLAGTQQPIAKKLDLVTPWGKSHLNKTFKNLDAFSTQNKTSFRPQMKQGWVKHSNGYFDTNTVGSAQANSAPQALGFVDL